MRNRKLSQRDYTGQDCSGKDFSQCDIRGVDFTRAILEDADFHHAKAGQPVGWVVGLSAGLLLILAINGMISGFAGNITSISLLEADQANPLAWSLPTFGLSALLLGLLFWRGLDLLFFGIVGAVAVLGAIAVILLNEAIAHFVVIYGFFIAAQLLSALIGAVAWGSLWLISRQAAVLAGGIFLLSALGTVAAFDSATRGSVPVERMGLSYFVLAVVIAINLLVCAYLAGRSLASDRKYRLLRHFIVYISAVGGTRFYQADLTGANFSHAVLEKTDLREANLTGCCWLGAQKLTLARIAGTYLASPLIQTLVTTLAGKGQIYDGLNLRNLNLAGAQLQDASFVGTDLSDVDLSGADLWGAKLVRSQLYQANLSGACLTGAYIQDWGISANTRLQNIVCDYVYMHLPTPADPDPRRKPDNRHETFQPGDFEDFITPIVKTLDLYQQQHIDPRKMATAFKSLDLYHHDGVDPTAAAIALNQLATDHPEAEINVVALDSRGPEKIRVQAQVTGNADRSALNQQYFEKYHQALLLPYTQQQALLTTVAEKNERIQSLESLLKSALKAGESYLRMDADKITQKILILSANPTSTHQHHLALEVREIKAGLQRAQKRDCFEIISKWAVRPEDLRRALLDYEPHIVHFSSYGSKTEGLALENDQGQTHAITTEALTNLFEIFKGKVECVLFNACYSGTQAAAICQHIHYVIGMEQGISNEAAIHFSVGFYDAIGAGKTIEDAFRFGCSAVELESSADVAMPILNRGFAAPAPN